MTTSMIKTRTNSFPSKPRERRVAEQNERIASLEHQLVLQKAKYNALIEKTKTILASLQEQLNKDRDEVKGVLREKDEQIQQLKEQKDTLLSIMKADFKQRRKSESSRDRKIRRSVPVIRRAISSSSRKNSAYVGKVQPRTESARKFSGVSKRMEKESPNAESVPKLSNALKSGKVQQYLRENEVKEPKDTANEHLGSIDNCNVESKANDEEMKTKNADMNSLDPVIETSTFEGELDPRTRNCDVCGNEEDDKSAGDASYDSIDNSSDNSDKKVKGQSSEPDLDETSESSLENEEDKDKIRTGDDLCKTERKSNSSSPLESVTEDDYTSTDSYTTASNDGEESEPEVFHTYSQPGTVGSESQHRLNVLYETVRKLSPIETIFKRSVGRTSDSDTSTIVQQPAEVPEIVIESESSDKASDDGGQNQPGIEADEKTTTLPGNSRLGSSSSEFEDISARSNPECSSESEEDSEDESNTEACHASPREEDSSENHFKRNANSLKRSSTVKRKPLL